MLRAMATTWWERPDLPSENFVEETEYPQLKTGYFGPSSSVLKHADSPIALFLYFMSPDLWSHIAIESNRYHTDMLDKRVDAAYKAHQKRRRKNSSIRPKTRQQIRMKLIKMNPIAPSEILRYIGLLVARTIFSSNSGLSGHWTTVEDGAISRGAFGSVMSRDRFWEISRNLHFANNADSATQRDRAGKIRPVVTELQKTFQSGYVLPPVMSFDEGMLPSRSKFNRMHVYMKDKPHKWGTKMFLTCCSYTAYCIR